MLIRNFRDIDRITAGASSRLSRGRVQRFLSNIDDINIVQAMNRELDSAVQIYLVGQWLYFIFQLITHGVFIIGGQRYSRGDQDGRCLSRSYYWIQSSRRCPSWNQNVDGAYQPFECFQPILTAAHPYCAGEHP